MRQPLRMLDWKATAITTRERRKSWISLQKTKRVRTGGVAVERLRKPGWLEQWLDATGMSRRCGHRRLGNA